MARAEVERVCSAQTVTSGVVLCALSSCQPVRGSEPESLAWRTYHGHTVVHKSQAAFFCVLVGSRGCRVALGGQQEMGSSVGCYGGCNSSVGRDTDSLDPLWAFRLRGLCTRLWPSSAFQVRSASFRENIPFQPSTQAKDSRRLMATRALPSKACKAPSSKPGGPAHPCARQPIRVVAAASSAQ